MPTIRNNTARPIRLPTGVTIARGETLTVEAWDITCRDNLPTIKSLAASGDITCDLAGMNETASPSAPSAVDKPAGETPAEPAPETPSDAPVAVKK